MPNLRGASPVGRGKGEVDERGNGNGRRGESAGKRGWTVGIGRK